MVILYGKGGTADCGRHAVEVALQDSAKKNIDEVLVLTQYPELLEETNWNCGCPGGHSLSEDQRQRLNVVKVDGNWKDSESLVDHFHNAFRRPSNRPTAVAALSSHPSSIQN